jgi:hypothetical protein
VPYEEDMFGGDVNGVRAQRADGGEPPVGICLVEEGSTAEQIKRLDLPGP